MITSAVDLATKRTVRCGAILYTLEDCDKTKVSTLSFCLARDAPTGELTDFGGGVRKNEPALKAGLRELDEESRSIFSSVCGSANDVATCLAVVNDKMAVIFIPVERKWITDAQKLFAAAESTKKRCNEVSEIVWVSEEQFKSLIMGKKTRDTKDTMWKKVRAFFGNIYKNDDFSNTLRKVARMARV
jgi:hypothetical protein